MSDKELLQLVYSLAHLDEYRRKQIAILLISTTLTDHAVEEIAGYMVGLADNLNDGEDDIGLQ